MDILLGTTYHGESSQPHQLKEVPHVCDSITER
jgi:hypothetical protein